MTQSGRRRNERVKYIVEIHRACKTSQEGGGRYSLIYGGGGYHIADAAKVPWLFSFGVHFGPLDTVSQPGHLVPRPPFADAALKSPPAVCASGLEKPGGGCGGAHQGAGRYPLPPSGALRGESAGGGWRPQKLPSRNRNCISQAEPHGSAANQNCNNPHCCELAHHFVCLQRRRPKGAAEVAAEAGELAWRCRSLLRELRPYRSRDGTTSMASMAAVGPGSDTTGSSVSARSLVSQGSHSGGHAAAGASGGTSLHVVCDKACQTPHLLRCHAGSWEGVGAPPPAGGGCSGGTGVCWAGAGPAGSSRQIARYRRVDTAV